jgi:hypothetical protein
MWGLYFCMPMICFILDKNPTKGSMGFQTNIVIHGCDDSFLPDTVSIIVSIEQCVRERVDNSPFDTELYWLVQPFDEHSVMVQVSTEKETKNLVAEFSLIISNKDLNSGYALFLNGQRLCTPKWRGCVTNTLVSLFTQKTLSE